jgi:hypothetical protein
LSEPIQADRSNIVQVAGDVAMAVDIRLKLGDLVSQFPSENLEVLAWMLMTAHQSIFL